MATSAEPVPASPVEADAAAAARLQDRAGDARALDARRSSCCSSSSSSRSTSSCASASGSSGSRKNEAAAELTGELASFSTQLWSDFLGHGRRPRASSAPATVAHAAWRRRRSSSCCSSLGAVFGSRLPRLRRLGHRRLVRPAARAVHDDPVGEQPAAGRRAVVGGRLPPPLLQVGHDGDDLGGARRASSRSRSPTSSPSGSGSRSTRGC